MIDKTIIIADYEHLNLEFFELMLSKLGFQVLAASTGAQALELIRTWDVDLIMLDSALPQTDGWEVTRTVKQSEEFKGKRHIPIIMFSSNDTVENKVAGYELGIEAYITKPFNFSEVFARIRAVLRTRELLRQLIERERRIALIESLNKSLIYFTHHLRQPVVDRLEAIVHTDCSDPEKMDRFVKLVETEAKQTLATLDGLEDEINDLLVKGDESKAQALTLEMLEEKYRERFKYYRNNPTSKADS